MMKLLIALQLLVLSATSVLSQSIAELAASLPDFSILVDLVSIDDPVIEPVLARITGSQPTTVFAPVNAAFEALPAATIAYLQANPDVLAQVLLYHAVDGAVESSAIGSDPISVPTLLGAEVVAERQYIGILCFIGVLCQEIVTINDAVVLLPDVAASNGVVHVIDRVLTPPDVVLLDIVDTAIAQHLDTLVAVAAAGNLVDFLRSPGPKTVFAPSEKAWQSLPAGFLETLLLPENVNLLTDILQYHVLDGVAVESSSISSPTDVTMVSGETVSVTSDGTNVFVNGATVIAADVKTTNGIVHVIDQILLPPGVSLPPDIVDLAVADPDLSSLVDALVQEDLVSALDTAGPFTVLAPTNAAFAALDGASLGSIPLEQVLLYHVLPGNFLAADVSALTSATTLTGQSIALRVENGMVYVNDAQVIQTDIVGTNGVIHKIDGVLIPSPMEESECNDLLCWLLDWIF